MIRTLLTRFTTDVPALRDELASAANTRDQLRREVERLSWELNRATEERDRLRALAGNTAPTPAEQTVLDVVARMPGALAKEIGRAVIQEWADAEITRHGDAPIPAHAWYVNAFSDHMVSSSAKPLTDLYRKGLVRRERAGQSFRYWIVDVGGAA